MEKAQCKTCGRMVPRTPKEFLGRRKECQKCYQHQFAQKKNLLNPGLNNRKNKAWREKNPGLQRRRNLEWRSENRERYNEGCLKRVKVWREKLRQDPERWAEFTKRNAERQRLYRLKKKKL